MNQLIGKVPVGVSRTIHLSAEDLETLFGPGYELTPIKIYPKLDGSRDEN